MNGHAVQTAKLLCDVVCTLPIGTNLALLHLLWMMVSGQLLLSRGAVIPGLHQMGLSDRAVRRAWRALRRGGWTIGQLIANWEATVTSAGSWQVRYHGGYCALAVDITGFWRPRLKNCPTKHYDHRAGKALPAIILGLIGRVGQIGQQRLALPLDILRADPKQPDEENLMRALLVRAKTLMQLVDVLVSDGGFPLELIHNQEIPRYVAKQAKNFTARRAQPPAYAGQGRPAQLGVIVRPLARSYNGHLIQATPPDRTESWQKEERLIHADIWDNLVLRATKSSTVTEAPTFSVFVFYDPDFAQPLLLVTPLTLAACHVLALYLDRWPIEQVPLVSKQMIGAQRAFVFAAEVCQRLPELTLLAGAILSYAAAILPAVPTGFWDRKPQPTSGRLRRYLARCGFPSDFPLAPEIRQKASVTGHLPKGILGHRRQKQTVTP
jgi:hypothetical protein